ncbi:putative RTA1 domain protein [Talaromyces proteolyticus]|uniref:RTA1 domain protein n=1 Tax=Talaromyces proteolyticus TaxID=1131652 RepID=A0AAD4KXD9_9EURO|nr:putative RTA1 domain protein [Talaromyces proteolyticus]KAH8701568.1 putative RTA1 domain protein [Talaromyces proteolyticus]
MGVDSTMGVEISNYYLYEPSHAAPAVFSALIGISLILHLYQNFRYKFWRVTFFMVWGGLVFLIGWIARTVSSYHTGNLNLYIVQTIFIYAGPPIYSAAAYNIVGRLMNYLPMHTPLNPNRVLILFVYLGALVEGLTAAGGAKISAANGRFDVMESGGTLMSVALLLQAVVETILVSMVGLIHYRCANGGAPVPPNVRRLCITLYGTSTLVIVRCICRAVESFTLYKAIAKCEGGSCSSAIRNDFVLTHEWYIFVFEAVPMVLFTFWLNLLHPAQCLPRVKTRYLDLDGKTERMGPGWIDRRSQWKTFADPLDLSGVLKGKPNNETFWVQPEKWPLAEDGSFAAGTATNVGGRRARLPSKSTPDTLSESV